MNPQNTKIFAVIVLVGVIIAAALVLNFSSIPNLLKTQCPGGTCFATVDRSCAQAETAYNNFCSALGGYMTGEQLNQLHYLCPSRWPAALCRNCATTWFRCGPEGLLGEPINVCENPPY
ncbi:MAG: hypothetical protein G01um1014106_735 [Parcubacteria group bacterium Gr01-1014_106]|nr:MAG: hypothetical protein G01um1014106_735 [Parcubacteria group bacterium Gr01-1014_106]